MNTASTAIPAYLEEEETTGSVPFASLSRTAEFMFVMPVVVPPLIEVPPPTDWIFSRECEEELQEAEEDLAAGRTASFASAEALLQELKI